MSRSEAELSALPLTWRRWPVTAAVPFVAGPAWQQAAAALARGPHRVWLVATAEAGVVTADRTAAVPALVVWARSVRRATRIPGVLLAPDDAVDWAWLAACARAAGGLLVVVPQQRSAEALDALKQRLAALREPSLAVAALAQLPCQSLGQLDVVLERPVAAPVWQAACGECAARERCPGPTPGAVVAAQQAAVSNQLDLVWTEADGPAPWRVWVDDGWHALRTPQGGVPDPATDPLLAQAVARGQLYLDVSSKTRLDDFAADLRLLAVDSAGWRPAERAPFAAEEARLVERIVALSGTIVDVGAGPIRYLGHLAQAIAAQTVRYLAVEPDAAALQRTREALPGAVLLQGTGEALPLQDACADAVLLLRSVNHIPDLKRGLQEALRVLRPGGTLLLVDNVVFAQVRSAAQLAAAHAISTEETPFEHFRNDDAASVLQVLGELAPLVRVVTVDDVGPGTSNQWCIVAERA